jgi:hypothetical protein
MKKQREHLAVGYRKVEITSDMMVFYALAQGYLN